MQSGVKYPPFIKPGKHNVQDQVAPATFRVDQAATLAHLVKVAVLVEGTEPELS